MLVNIVMSTLLMGSYYLACLYTALRFGQFLWAYGGFWIGYRRDLYFMPAEDHVHLLMVNWGGFTMSFMGILGPILLLVNLWISSLIFWGIALLFLVITIAAIIIWSLGIRPTWVTLFEQGRSQEDIAYIRHRGLLMLKYDPEPFERIIRSQEGWDLWVMTLR